MDCSVINSLQSNLIVSCQSYPGEPMRDSRTMAQIAAAVVKGGASAVRLQGIKDIQLGRSLVGVPIIGLVKVGDEGVYITPTLADALRVVEAGADIVALDGTDRPRPDGLTLKETVKGIRAHSTALIMADCGCLADAVWSQEAGVDLVGTTLSGYTPARVMSQGPDYALIDELVEAISLPVVAEGRIHTPDQAYEALKHGAFAVCVGTAITHPTTITSWFVAGLHRSAQSVESSVVQ